MFAQPNISYFPLDRVYTLISPNLIEKAGLEKNENTFGGNDLIVCSVYKARL
jgi:hypothetical protein